MIKDLIGDTDRERRRRLIEQGLRNALDAVQDKLDRALEENARLRREAAPATPAKCGCCDVSD